MANPEHLKILKQGIEAWNIWRKENPDIRPDLRTANLFRADLRHANFSDTDLHSTILIEANLSDAIFIEANLSNAILIVSDLRGAYLNFANLHNADLSGADLKESVLNDTIFGATNIKDAQNLNSCIHLGPSIIDQMTLVQSGPLPEAFLKGCGLTDEFIQQIPFLFWEKATFEFYSCFISYSTKDKDFAERLYADLQHNGVRCWFAPEDLKIGDKFRQRIDETIRIYDKLLLILSQDSLNSAWVETEVETAFEKERRGSHTVLFPIRLDEQVMETDRAWAADVRRTRHIGDFTNWKNHDSYQQAFQRLLRDLKAS